MRLAFLTAWVLMFALFCTLFCASTVETFKENDYANIRVLALIAIMVAMELIAGLGEALLG